MGPAGPIRPCRAAKVMKPRRVSLGTRRPRESEPLVGRLEPVRSWPVESEGLCRGQGTGQTTTSKRILQPVPKEENLVRALTERLATR
jgi:hypothetical protein